MTARGQDPARRGVWNGPWRCWNEKSNTRKIFLKVTVFGGFVKAKRWVLILKILSSSIVCVLVFLLDNSMRFLFALFPWFAHQVSGMDMKKWRDEMIPLLLDVMQDPLLSMKREVSRLISVLKFNSFKLWCYYILLTFWITRFHVCSWFYYYFLS